MRQRAGYRSATFISRGGVTVVAIAAAIVVLSIAGSLRASTTTDGLFTAGTARSYFREVLLASLTASRDTERAAFIVQGDDGSLTCQLWPPMNLYHREVFRGSLPSGTLAIIQTHPDTSPRPSSDDQIEADRLGIPIYVVTRRDVFKAEPGHRTATPIVRREWWLSGENVLDGAHCSR